MMMKLWSLILILLFLSSPLLAQQEQLEDFGGIGIAYQPITFTIGLKTEWAFETEDLALEQSLPENLDFNGSMFTTILGGVNLFVASIDSRTSSFSNPSIQLDGIDYRLTEMIYHNNIYGINLYYFIYPIELTFGLASSSGFIEYQYVNELTDESGNRVNKFNNYYALTGINLDFEWLISMMIDEPSFTVWFGMTRFDPLFKQNFGFENSPVSTNFTLILLYDI